MRRKTGILRIIKHRTSRLPVIYVFGKKPIDIDDCAAQFARIVEEQLASDSSKKFVLVNTDVAYAYATGMLFDAEVA